MSLRSRLTIWYLAALSSILLVFGTAVYSLLSINMIRQIDSTLQRTAENMVLASILQVRGVPLSLIQLELDLTANVYVQVIDTNMELIRQSQNLMGMEDPMDMGVLPVSYPQFSIAEFGTSRLRVFSVPVSREEDGSIIAYYQLASSLNAVDHAQRTLLLILVGGGVGAMLLGAVIIWSATGNALFPLKQATDTAEAITQSANLSLRIETRSIRNDEVGRLVHAFNETLNRLQKLFESQQQFMTDVSHELRTPLTTIMGNLAYIQKIDRIDKPALSSMIKESERMSRLVKDLLFLNRAEQGEMSLEKRVVELDTLLLEVFQQAKMLAGDQIHVVMGEEDQARVLGDRDRLKQVFLNLVVNAIDFTPAGGQVTINVQCLRDRVEIRIEDTGEGIPAESLPYIFDRFYRTDPSRNRRKLGGAGLGLSIAHWIITAHQGSIDVQSTPGEGSVFIVTLPAYTGSATKE
ncbi:MAG: HAMP domain-containing protein [Anaerolineales bacterium]|nr:HAMP domain-containing protein [Anaerolineales bacterium]